MEIIDYYYDEDEQTLDVRFTTDPNSDFYRVVILTIDDIFYYTPTVIGEEDLMDIDEDFVIELLVEYYRDHDLPEEELF